MNSSLIIYVQGETAVKREPGDKWEHAKWEQEFGHSKVYNNA